MRLLTTLLLGLTLATTPLAAQDAPPLDACIVLVINNIPDGPTLAVAIRQGEFEAVFDDHPLAAGQYISISVDCDIPELDLWIANYYDRREPLYRRVSTPAKGKTAIWCLGPCPFEPRIGESNEARERERKGPPPSEVGGREDGRARLSVPGRG